MEASPIVVSASYTLTITGFDIDSGSVRKEFEMQNCQANRLHGIREENRLYAAGYSYVFIFDTTMKTKKPLATIHAHDGNVMDLSIYQNTLVTCGDDKSIKIWDRKSNTKIETITTESVTNCVYLVPGTTYVVSGNEDGYVHMYDMNDPEGPICTHKMSNKPVRSIAVTPDGKRVLAVEQSGKLACFELSDGKLNIVYESVAHNDITTRVVMSKGGKLFATCAANNTTKLWNLQTGELVQSMIASDERIWIWDAVFVMDDRKIVTVGSDGSTRLFDCDTGRMEMTYAKAEKANSCVTVL